MVFREIKCILSLEFITERTPALLGHFWVACKPIRKENHCFRWIITQGTSTTRINTLPPTYREHWQWQAASTGLPQPPHLLPAQHPWGACSLAISCGEVFLGKNCNTLPLTCFSLDTLWLPADITNKQSFWMLCCWVAGDGFGTGTFLVGMVVIHLWRPLSGSCCMFLILGKMQKTARAPLTVGDHISLPHCYCCPQGTLPWAGGQEEVLFSGCGCAVGRWGHFTDACTAAQGRIMMLPFIGTRDLQKLQADTFLPGCCNCAENCRDKIHLYLAHKTMLRALKEQVNLYISPEQWQDVKNMIKRNTKNRLGSVSQTYCHRILSFNWHLETHRKKVTFRK